MTLKSATCGVGLRSGACEAALLLLGVRCSPALHLIRFERHQKVIVRHG